MQKPIKFSLIFLALLQGSPAVAEVSDEDELAQAYGDAPQVSIATGRRQDIVRAPAAATVITAQDIAAMGAIDLDQVLESVPGLHVSEASAANRPIYSIRGIHTFYNPHVLMLVNGIPITNVFLGNRGQIWGGMPLENVARIEVIRGPGSALYGADAFAGVINVITRTAEDIQGSEAGVRGGSFNSYDAWLQHGRRHGEVDASLYLRTGHTDGHERPVELDLMSLIDPALSRAPGPMNNEREALDARMDLGWQQWRFRAGYQEREVGIGTGLAESLDPYGKGPAERLFLDLTYQSDTLLPNWSVMGVAGFSDIREEAADRPYMLFPPGANLGGGVFPDGILANPGHAERHTHASFSAFYSGIERHRVRIGVGYRLEDLYETTEVKNFRLVTPGPVFIPIGNPPGSLVDVTGSADIFLTPHQREVTYAFVQDEWSLSKDWTLTAGLRHDHYSDFGETTNPRLALVWDAAYNLVVRAMHGRAFRAPSFAEQYNINNPVNIGNPDLDPETIATTELVFSWQTSPSLQTDLTLFHYRMEDIIRFVPNPVTATGYTAQNAGVQTGRGLELEARWDPTRVLRLTGNLSLQRSLDEATDDDAGLAPQQRLFARADWRFLPQWQLGTTVNHVAGRERQPGDARSELDDYTTADLSLQREKLFGGVLDLRAAVQNVFDTDAREPSLAPGNIPLDLPLPGRTFYVQMQSRF
jgi:iron complex outermembrane receptor protein